MKINAFRRLWFAPFILVFVLALAPSAPAVGKAGNEFIYYSDATFTHQVGIWIFCRNGQSFRSGQITQFVKIEPSGC